MMDKFTNLIRRYSPQEVMKQFYKLSLQMMEHDNKGFLDIPIYILTKKGGMNREQIILPVWKISEIVYWAIVKSNDYREKELDDNNLIKIINAFNEFDDERTDASFLENVKYDEMLQFLLGLIAEQEQFQNLRWLIDCFNRNYHILVGSNKIKRNLSRSCEEIIEEKVGVSLHDFCKILIVLSGIGKKMQEPLACKSIELLGIKQDDFNKVINYYSTDYDEVRKSKLGAKIFYLKPFVRTKYPKHVLAVTYHQVSFLIANGLYWVIRNYYYEAGTQEFVNAFGEMFEDYLSEFSKKYLTSKEFQRLEHKDSKIADFRFEFEDCIILIEQKSALLSLNAKSQTPNMTNIKQFLNRNIAEAYGQLEATYKRESSTKPILKFILLYEHLENAQLVQAGMPEIFEKDSMCYVVGIAEFEQILKIRKEDYELWKKLLKKLLSREKANVAVTNILRDLEGFNYSSIFKEADDYFQKYLDEMEI